MGRKKSFIASITGKVALVSVALDMLIQLASIHKSSGAMLANVGQFFGVTSLVDPQSIRAKELFRAVCAGVGSLAQVTTQMGQ